MNQDVLLNAVIETARKRRFLGMAGSARLGDFARQRGITNLDGLRQWLESGDGLSAHLAGQLRGILAKPDDQPFGPYLPLTHLADGGMGSVWLASNPQNELVVVKTLKSSLAQQQGSTQGTEFMKRFEREARITQQLVHPSVVRCLDNGVRTDGTAFMVLEYVDSGDLKDLVETRGGLSEGLALAIFYQVVDALSEAHRIHLIHRDIKPANIFVSSTGRAKMADFGIARSTEQSRTMLTMEGAIVGSPLYMSPEQILTDPNLDIRSDIYALGAVLYYMLAAQPPYDGRIQEVLHKHCTASVPDIRVLRNAVSEHTHHLIIGCMAKERDKRFREPGQLLSATANALVRLGLTPGQIEEDTRPGDLSDNSSGFRPAVPKTNDRTLTIDLSDEDRRPPRGDVEAHTIVANLLAEGASQATAATLMTRIDTADGATAMTMVPTTAPHRKAAANDATDQRIDGDFATALTDAWIALVGNGGDSSQVVLFAKPMIVLGKLREPPVDLPLRYYPVMAHKDSLQRISRQHVRLAYDRLQDHCTLEDLGAANGTMLDGITLRAQQSVPLEAGLDNILVLAGVASLWLRCHPRTMPVVHSMIGAPAGDPAAACGLEADLGYDAVTISRPENRPDAAYALVLRRLTIGGPGAELALGGARTRSAVEVARYAGHWLWRLPTDSAWRPLTDGTELDIGGRRLVARRGDYTHFD